MKLLSSAEQAVVNKDFGEIWNTKMARNTIIVVPLIMMVNEEDHIHFQSSEAGLNLEKAFERVDKLDDILNKSLHFAFDENLGYLTQNPVNLGTGMRASLTLHLPALREGGGIARLSTNLSKLGLALRGAFWSGMREGMMLFM